MELELHPMSADTYWTFVILTKIIKYTHIFFVFIQKWGIRPIYLSKKSKSATTFFSAWTHLHYLTKWCKTVQNMWKGTLFFFRCFLLLLLQTPNNVFYRKKMSRQTSLRIGPQAVHLLQVKKLWWTVSTMSTHWGINGTAAIRPCLHSKYCLTVEN